MAATLAELVDRRSGSDDGGPVLTFVEVGPTGGLRHACRSYADLHRGGGTLAAWLAARGVGSGDRFAIMMDNRPEFAEAMVAASWLGAVFVPVDPRTRGDKLAHMLAFSDCVGVVAADQCVAALDEVADSCAALSWVLVVGDDTGARPDWPRFSAIGEEALATPSAAPTKPDDAMFMMFTSGTTGRPKAVIHTHGEYIAAATGPNPFGLRPGDRFYTGLSLTHINAQGTMRLALGNGTPIVISRKFTKSRLWDIVRGYDCTIFSLLGGMIPEMFSIPERADDADNPVRLLVTSGMPASLWEAYRKRFGVEIAEGYGSTEGGGVLFNPPGAGPVGSIGRPPPGLEAAVFDEAGDICPPFAPGELRFRPLGGEARPVPYFRDEAAGRAKIRDGWFLTGDVVHCDAEGWFFFHHRIGGGVRRNGDFVNTALVEAVISRSGLVDDVFVYGVATPANVAGEKTLVAAVVPAKAGLFDADGLRAFCAAHLERNDVPEIIQPLEAIPKTASEKPIEREAAALLRQTDMIAAPHLVTH